MKTIILISGKQGSGKSSTADAIFLNFGSHRAYRTRFAKALYLIHDAACAKAKEFGIDVKEKEGEMLQWIGTEWGRTLKGNNVWVDALKEDLKKNMKDDTYAIIDDCRFLNEFHAFDDDKDFRTIKVRFECDKETRKKRVNYWRENDEHPSETDLDNYTAEGKFDLTVDTDKNNISDTLKIFGTFLENFRFRK